MRRHALGIFSAVLILAGIILLANYGNAGEMGMAASVCLRAGLVVGAIWLAFPQLSQISTRFPPWLIGCCLVGIGVLVWRPQLFVVVGPLLGAIAVIQFFGWLMKPPPKRKRKPRATTKTQSTKVE